LSFFKVTASGEVLNINGDLLTDPYESNQILKSLRLENNKYLTPNNEIVEVSDFPYIVDSILEIGSESLKATAQYDLELVLNLNQIYLDYKDQFIIYTMEGIPALLSESAQDQLFDLADEFSDDDITIQGKVYRTDAWINKDAKISDPGFWSQRYQENITEWDLNEASPSLVWALTKFKLPKLRVAVLGCGKGHDAYYFSSLGHKAVGFDFSPEAIAAAKNKYGETQNLSWKLQDIFNLDESLWGQFDLVFDHTLFCAVDPEQRNAVVKSWQKLLADQGQLLGVFFTMPNRNGPPYGATEGEIRDRISPYFRTDYWARSRASTPKRMGKELIVLATKY
jgi:SAM-dependent methyltransferase